MSFMPKHSSSESDFYDGWTVVEQNYCSEEILDNFNILEAYFDTENVSCAADENVVQPTEDYANDADAETDAVSTSEKDETTKNSKISKLTRKKIKSRPPSPKPSSNDPSTNSRTRTPKKIKSKINRAATPPNTPQEPSVSNMQGTKKPANYQQDQKPKVNKPSIRKKFYRHHRNSKINNVFNLILAGAVVTAAGLAFGHLLGFKRESTTKIVKPTADISLDITKLQKENQMLKFQLDEIRRHNICESTEDSRFAESISNAENKTHTVRIPKCTIPEKMERNRENDLLFKDENKSTILNNKTKLETDKKNSIKVKRTKLEKISKVTTNSNLFPINNEQACIVNKLTDTKKTGIEEMPIRGAKTYEDYCAILEPSEIFENVVATSKGNKKTKDLAAADINNNLLNSPQKSNNLENSKQVEEKPTRERQVIHLDTRAKETIKDLENMNSGKTVEKQNTTKQKRPAGRRVHFKSGTKRDDRKTNGGKCSARGKETGLTKYNKMFGKRYFAGVCKAQRKNEKYNKWDMKKGYMYDLEEESNNDYDDNFFEENISHNRKTITLNDVLVNNNSLNKTEEKKEFVKSDGVKQEISNKILDGKNERNESEFVEEETLKSVTNRNVKNGSKIGKCYSEIVKGSPKTEEKKEFVKNDGEKEEISNKTLDEKNSTYESEFVEVEKLKAVTKPKVKKGSKIEKSYSEIAKGSPVEGFKKKEKHTKSLKCCSEINNHRQSDKVLEDKKSPNNQNGFCVANIVNSINPDGSPDTNLTKTLNTKNVEKQRYCDIDRNEKQKPLSDKTKKTLVKKIQAYDSFNNSSETCYKSINYKKQYNTQKNQGAVNYQSKKTWSKNFNTCPRKV